MADDGASDVRAHVTQADAEAAAPIFRRGDTRNDSSSISSAQADVAPLRATIHQKTFGPTRSEADRFGKQCTLA